MARLGRVPKTADHFEWGGMKFEVMDMDGRRIDKANPEKSLLLLKPTYAVKHGGGKLFLRVSDGHEYRHDRSSASLGVPVVCLRHATVDGELIHDRYVIGTYMYNDRLCLCDWALHYPTYRKSKIQTNSRG